MKKNFRVEGENAVRASRFVVESGYESMRRMGRRVDLAGALLVVNPYRWILKFNAALSYTAVARKWKRENTREERFH